MPPQFHLFRPIRAHLIWPVTALVNGPILGFLLTFVAIYLFSVFSFAANEAKDVGVEIYLLALWFGMFGVIPGAFILALISGLVIGLYGGIVCGPAGFPVIILTTGWLPPVVRLIVVSIVMAIGGVGAAIGMVYFGVFDYYTGLPVVPLLPILGGGLFGLILGFIVGWPLTILDKPKRKPLLTALVVGFFIWFHLIVPLVILGPVIILYVSWHKALPLF